MFIVHVVRDQGPSPVNGFIGREGFVTDRADAYRFDFFTEAVDAAGAEASDRSEGGNEVARVTVERD